MSSFQKKKLVILIPVTHFIPISYRVDGYKNTNNKNRIINQIGKTFKVINDGIRYQFHLSTSQWLLQAAAVSMEILLLKGGHECSILNFKLEDY